MFTLPCPCCNPRQHHSQCLLVNVQTIPFLTSLYLSWKSLFAISYTQESDLSSKHQQQCPSSNSKTTKVLVICWSQRYKIPSVGSFLKAVSNRFIILYNSLESQTICWTSRSASVLKTRKVWIKLSRFLWSEKKKKKPKTTHKCLLRWLLCFKNDQRSAATCSTLMDWTPTNNCHWVCSTDFLQGTQDQTGGFWTLLFCRVLKFFWSLEHRLQILHLYSLNATIPWSYTACWSYSKTVFSQAHFTKVKCYLLI